ncbi:MAG: ATP-dependent 6-phosphofructokinase [Proteobacteria bacterium]|nr:ATP-dependent 6-phosphofructokinase [Pseudomonadota bacterium]
MKRIGILTSGGDCAGLNAAMRSIFYRAKKYGMDVIGIKDGTLGLIQRPINSIELNYQIVSGALFREGGTFLGTTNKGDPFHFKGEDGKYLDVSDKIIEGYKLLKLDGLIVIGGDGSMKIFKKLADKGKLNIVAIPKTIDNDVGATENSIGFNTAVSVATEALDNLQATAASHHRAMILQVMGRDAGHIALNTGIAGGADVILIPELPYTVDGIQYADGEKRLGGIGDYLAEQIMKKSNIECRVTTLGHVQRGARPTANDRILASAFGVHAVDLLARGKFNRMVAWQNRGVVDVAIDDAMNTYKVVDQNEGLVDTAFALGIYIGTTD